MSDIQVLLRSIGLLGSRGLFEPIRQRISQSNELNALFKLHKFIDFFNKTQALKLLYNNRMILDVILAIDINPLESESTSSPFDSKDVGLENISALARVLKKELERLPYSSNKIRQLLQDMRAYQESDYYKLAEEFLSLLGQAKAYVEKVHCIKNGGLIKSEDLPVIAGLEEDVVSPDKVFVKINYKCDKV